MNIEINIPTKITIIDDNKDSLFVLAMLLKEKGFQNVDIYSEIPKLMSEMDNSKNIFIVDYHLCSSINGGELSNMIKEVNPDAEFIFVSSLLSPEEYENLINTCGCKAISRKSDIEKIVFLLNRAIETINLTILRAMEIVIHGKALLEKIEKD